MTQELVMLKGLPGSGKTEWAKAYCAENPDARRVSQDTIMDFLGMRWATVLKNGSLGADTRTLLVKSRLAAGHTVLVDAWNLRPEDYMALKEIAKEYGVPLRVRLFNTDTNTCVMNDRNREDQKDRVGEKTIRQLAKVWKSSLAEAPNVPKWRHRERIDAPYCIIVDLDGTISLFCNLHECDCDLNHRDPYDASTAHADVVNPAVHAILCAFLDRNVGLPDSYRTQVIFVSGRDEKYREQTQAFLRRHWYGSYPLYMRPSGTDEIDDTVIKRALFDEHIAGKFNVRFVLDDRDRVVRMWREMGLDCLQVRFGDF